MKAALLYGAHDFRIEDITLPALKEDECLVDVKTCGVCHSEIHQWDKKIPDLDYPRHIGHEVSGIVKKCGSKIKNFKPGDRIAAWVDGKGYADQINIKEDRLFKMSDDLPFDLAILEPVACTTNAVLKTQVTLGDTVALCGTGFMGLILLQQIKLAGASRIIAIDIRDEMLELAKKLGADIIINPNQVSVKKEILKLTDEKGVDISYEIGVVQKTFDMASEILRMEGKLVIFGYHPGQRIIENLGYWNWMAFDIINAHFRNINTILNGSKIGMQLLNEKRINMEPLITHKLHLDEIEKAFQLAKDKPKGFVKSVVVM